MIRLLTAEDVAPWRALRLEGLETEPPAFDLSAEEWRAKPEGQIAALLAAYPWFGAFAGADLIGTLGLKPETFGSARHRASVVSVYLTRRHRGTGIAAQLLERAIETAKERGIWQLELGVRGDDPIARRFYSRHGFEVMGTIPEAFCHGGVYRDEILMRLRLRP